MYDDIERDSSQILELKSYDKGLPDAHIVVSQAWQEFLQTMNLFPSFHPHHSYVRKTQIVH